MFWHAGWKQRIENKLDALLREVRKMQEVLDKLRAAVAKEETVGDSMLVLLQGLSAQIEANKTDPAALQAIADDLNAKADAWAAAVATVLPAV